MNNRNTAATTPLLRLICLADCEHKLNRPNSFYGLEAGRLYSAQLENTQELEGEKFIYLITPLGMRNVRLARFAQIK